MKKVILSVLVAGSLMATSCKKTKEAAKEVKEGTEKVANDVKEGAEKTVEATKDAAKTVESAISGVSIPEFEDAKLTEYTKAYVDYAKSYIDAKGDVLKGGLGEKGAKLAQEASAFSANMSPSDAKKFAEFMNVINTKMVEATKK